MRQSVARVCRRAVHAGDPRAVDPVALGLLVCLIVLAGMTPYPEYRPLFAALSVIGTVGTVWLWWRDRLSTAQILVGAVIARAVFLPLGPSLSDDMYRYVWDGWLQLEGLNPYQLRPVDVPELFTRQDELLGRLNSSGYYSVYPPISQMIFALGAGMDHALGGLTNGAQSYYSIKTILAAMEVAGLAVIARLTPARNLVLYAWSPLVIVETAGQGHTEAALVFFLALAVWCVRKEIGWGASLAVGAATMVKLYPVVLFPLLWRRFRWSGWIAGGALMVAVSLPYAATDVLGHVYESLGLYVQLFEFNAGPYFAVKHALWAFTGTDYSKMLGPLFQILCAGVLVAVYMVDRWRSWTFQYSSFLVLSAFLALSTTIHPWYLLAVLPLAVLSRRDPRRNRPEDDQREDNRSKGNRLKSDSMRSQSVSWSLRWAWIWLSAVAPVTYVFYTGGTYWPWVVIGWTGWGMILISAGLTSFTAYVRQAVRHVLRRRARKKAARLLPHLDLTSRASAPAEVATNGPRDEVRILDLGAGEGFVGEALRRETKASVQLCDVSDENQTQLPHDVYDGQKLPYADQMMDVTVLYFVLHHCSAPEQVIEEALRVTSGKVVIVESVVQSSLQKRLLYAADVLANRLRASSAMRSQEAHLDFRRTTEWIDVIHSAGATVEHVDESSGWIHPQTLLVVSPSHGLSGNATNGRPTSMAHTVANPPEAGADAGSSVTDQFDQNQK